MKVKKVKSSNLVVNTHLQKDRMAAQSMDQVCRIGLIKTDSASNTNSVSKMSFKQMPKASQREKAEEA